VTAAFPSCFGEAPNAAFIPVRAFAVCIRASKESNSSFRFSSFVCVALESAPYSSIESRTALGVSCLVISTMPP